jgi:hypothetical protein
MLTLMIGHVNVAGAQLSNGQPSIGHEIELNPKHLDRLGDIPKLLNHIHKPQDHRRRALRRQRLPPRLRRDRGEAVPRRALLRRGHADRIEAARRRADVPHRRRTLDREGFTLSAVGGDAEI